MGGGGRRKQKGERKKKNKTTRIREEIPKAQVLPLFADLKTPDPL